MPNVIVIETKIKKKNQDGNTKTDKYVIAAFSKTGWTKNMEVDHN